MTKPQNEENLNITETAEEIANKDEKKSPSIINCVGRRKSAIANISLIKRGQGNITVNGKDYKTVFTTFELQRTVREPLVAISQDDKLDVKAKVSGGGVTGQAEAIRLGISRALVKLNPIFKKALKKHKYLTRDPRVKERKKPGLKRARRAPQFSKR